MVLHFASSGIAALLHITPADEQQQKIEQELNASRARNRRPSKDILIGESSLSDSSTLSDGRSTKPLRRRPGKPLAAQTILEETSEESNP